MLPIIWMAAGWLATAQAGESRPISARVGQEFKLALPCNASTGYTWVLATVPDEKLVKLVKTDYKRQDSKLIGAGGTMVWTFKGLAEGKTEMKLNYVRPWEKAERPAQTTNFAVVIRAGKDGGKK